MINFSRSTSTRVLENPDIERLAPSVFAENAWHETSERYKFIPTIQVINSLRDNGFNVVSDGQSRTRIEGKENFTKHIIRLRHKDFFSPLNVGDEIPEIVLVNSHDKTSAYKFMLGIFRLVCSNGLIVASETIESLSVRHSGKNDLLNDVIDISAKITNEAPKVLEQISRFKQIELNQQEQIALATSANELLETTLEVKPERLLTYRRYADQGNKENGNNNLWKTSNIIQENLIRGGVLAKNKEGYSRRTRAVKCIQNNVGINKAIWRLTEEMAKLKS